MAVWVGHKQLGNPDSFVGDDELCWLLGGGDKHIWVHMPWRTESLEWKPAACLSPGSHRTWVLWSLRHTGLGQLWWGDAAVEMRKKRHFLGFDLLFLCVILIAHTPQPLPLPYPTPHRAQFLVCGLYLFGFAFFLVVFHAEMSGSLVSREVFRSTEGFVGLGLNKGRKCRYWGEGHGIVSWKIYIQMFWVFYKYQLKLSAWKKNTPWNTVLMLSLPYLHTGNSPFDRTDFSLLMKSMEQIPFRL